MPEAPGDAIDSLEIPQIPGYRRISRWNKSIAESLTTTGYVVPILLANPYIAGGLFVDYLVRGRFHPIPKHPRFLTLDNLSALTQSAQAAQNPFSAGFRPPAPLKAAPTRLRSRQSQLRP